jgi:hypothetical protein
LFIFLLMMQIYPFHQPIFAKNINRFYTFEHPCKAQFIINT